MARFDNGWIKLYRRALESDLGDSVHLWAVWTTLLSWATRVEQKRMIDGEQRVLPPGTVIFGITEMAKRWRISKSTVSDNLKYLTKSERISLERRPRGCIATIRNWDEYQNDARPGRTDAEQSANEVRTPAERQPNPIGEVENTRREEEIQGVSISEVSECLIAWEQTLTRLEVRKSAKLDEVEIARLLARHGMEKTKLALLGAGFEHGSKDYDPKKHVSIRRLAKPDVFETFVNLGAQSLPVERKVQEWKL